MYVYIYTYICLLIHVFIYIIGCFSSLIDYVVCFAYGAYPSPWPRVGLRIFSDPRALDFPALSFLDPARLCITFSVYVLHSSCLFCISISSVHVLHFLYMYYIYFFFSSLCITFSSGAWGSELSHAHISLEHIYIFLRTNSF